MRCCAGEETRSFDMSCPIPLSANMRQPKKTLHPSLPHHDRSLCTHIDIVLEFDSPRAVQLNFLQRLSHDVVRLVFGVLGRFDDGRFVEIALVVDVQLAEGVLQAEDFRLLELRIFPESRRISIIQRTQCIALCLLTSAT